MIHRLILPIQGAAVLANHSSTQVMWLLGSRNVTLYVSTVLAWSVLCAPVMHGLPVSCALGCEHFGVQAPALSTLSVSFTIDLVAWPPHRFLTRAAPAPASATATAIKATWLRLNCIIVAVLAAKMCYASKTATTTQLLRIILVLFITTNMAVLVVLTTIHAPAHVLKRHGGALQ